jgi:thiol-disulfide isomerase/thioredoxin
MMNLLRKRWLRRLLEISLIILVLVLVNAWRVRDTPTGSAPEISGVLLDGTPVTLSELRGRPVLLHFWATWCRICQLEQDSIDAIARDHAVITVAVDEEDPDNLRNYLAQRGVSYPVLHDRDNVIAARYGVRIVPASFILDPQGNIRSAEVGYTSGIGLRARLWWAGL